MALQRIGCQNLGIVRYLISIQVVKQVQKQKQYRDKTRPLLDSRHLYRKHYIRRGSSSVVQPSNFVSEWDSVGSHLDQTKFCAQQHQKQSIQQQHISTGEYTPTYGSSSRMSVLFIFSQKITMSSTPPEMRSTSVHTDKCIEIQLVFPSSRRHLDIYQTCNVPRTYQVLTRKRKVSK